MRRLASVLVPPALLRTLQRFLERRHDRALAPVRDGFVARHGTSVRHGPFAGMAYPSRLAQVAKLVGAYELELRPVVEEWIAAAPARIIDVGCAEGSYAVGFAHAIPAARVDAYDTLASAREDCAELAGLNGVAARVQIAGECTPTDLAAIEEDHIALFTDCEGYELELLRPDLVPRMRHWRILVELHDFIDPTISRQVLARFATTHEIELLSSRVRDGFVVPELADLTVAERRIALDEHRPGMMQWASMRPRGDGDRDRDSA